MQSIGIALTNRSLLPYGNDKVAAMGIVMKVNLIAVLVLVGFAFGAQPLIGYNYGAKNHARLKEILRFSYGFECCTAAVLAGALSLAAPAMIGIFMQDKSIIEVGVPMLRMQQTGMVFTAVVLVTTCTFQSAGKAVGAFLLSVSQAGRAVCDCSSRCVKGVCLSGRSDGTACLRPVDGSYGGYSL